MENINEVTVEKRKRRSTFYKSKYLTARGQVVMLVWLVVFLGALLFWTLRGNARLQQELAMSENITRVVR